ncbi:MarR family winged helix-turn-helix transcriptional regulator [Lactobacillus sp. B4026]|uniref:MarR family winged helix-turn-helix transcriptional regulator n=1 Tax=Lactobacillus sp. B4026 TaxID=2818035 RepID=UPI00226B5D59|nr:MarR family transcriptional regulator [Lactobacillus sp. B4026]MCX8735790.1 MarR family transcriptional regulator [Lactobacillus sp. B4026]
MSQTSDNLMKQLHFIMRASRYFMFENKLPISGQKRVLAVLKLEDGLTQNYLAEILALKPGSLAELLKKMEAKGIIRRETDEKDKRVKRVYLTEEGREEANKLDALKKKQDTTAFFAGLSEDEQTNFSHYLEKIADGWDADFKHEAQKFVDPAFRMQAYSKWHKYAESHDFSKEEMRQMCHQMHNRHHYHDEYCRDFKRPDFKHKYCDFDKKWEYDRDFWRKFWHNEDEEI